MDVTVAAASAQLGLKADTLRKWESRGLLPRPKRRANGYRAYAPADLHRLRAFVELVRAGRRPSDAAKETAIVAGPRRPEGDAKLEEQARAAAGAFDRPALEAVFARSVERHGLAGAFARVWQPALTSLGEAGHRLGGLWIAKEHFAVGAVRACLETRLRPAPGRPRLTLSAPEGELHELGMLAAWAALSDAGVPVLYLGPNLPLDSLVAALRRTGVRHAALTLTNRTTKPAAARLLRALRRRAPGVRVHLAGQASPALAGEARRLGAALLGSDLELALASLIEALQKG